MVGGCYDNAFAGEAVKHLKKAIHHPLQFTVLVIGGPTFPDRIKLIEEDYPTP